MFVDIHVFKTETINYVKHILCVHINVLMMVIGKKMCIKYIKSLPLSFWIAAGTHLSLP